MRILEGIYRIVFLVLLSTSTQAAELKLMVRDSHPQQTSLSSMKTSEVWSSMSIYYESEEELQEKLEALEANGMLWEQNVVYSGDVISESVNPTLSEFDEFFGLQWSLYNPISADSASFAGGDIDHIRALEYLESKGLPQGKGLLYVVDSGFDLNSPELGERLLEGFNVYEGQEGPFDENGHGTNVTTVAAAAKNEVGIVGVAPGEDVRVFPVKFLDENNQGDTEKAIQSLGAVGEHLSDYRANEDENVNVVINMSFGSTKFSQSFKEALRALVGPNVLFVASAGNNQANNDQTAYWPCNYNIANLICVGASDTLDNLASFSNFGRQSVDLIAPGLNILGAVIGEVRGDTYVGNYEDKSGTSQAAPHVSGAALLVWGANPELTATEVKSILINSVDRVPGLSENVLSGGRLNAYRAVLMATGDNPDAANRQFLQEDNEASSSSSGSCSLAKSPSRSEGSALFLFFILQAVGLFLLYRNMSRPGLEPGTHWLKASCSTD